MEIVLLTLKLFSGLHMRGSLVEWLTRRDCDRHGFGLKLLAPFCCVFYKDILRQFFLFDGLGKHL